MGRGGVVALSWEGVRTVKRSATQEAADCGAFPPLSARRFSCRPISVRRLF